VNTLMRAATSEQTVSNHAVYIFTNGSIIGELE
jgi:hypothetical protein